MSGTPRILIGTDVGGIQLLHEIEYIIFTADDAWLTGISDSSSLSESSEAGRGEVSGSFEESLPDIFMN